MRYVARSVFLFALLALAACGASGTLNDPFVPTITVLSPNGGESLLIGSSVTVSWVPGEFTGNVDIDISTDGGATWTALASGSANDGTEDVVVPAAPTHQARVRVGAADGDPAVAIAPSDESDGNVQIGGPPTAIGAGLEGVAMGALRWGDYDNDGDLDVAMVGCDENLSRISRIYNSDAGVFTDIDAGLEGVGFGTLCWGDYDNDGDLDLAVAGENEAFARVSRIYRNDAGTFTDIGAGLVGVDRCSLSWADYDNDGDLDLALAGRDDSFAPVSRVYRNDAGTFTAIGAGLEGVAFGSICWGDYDNDGDPDLALAGRDNRAMRISRVYRNDAGAFNDIGAPLEGVHNCALAWADFDNDGDLDLTLAGRDNGGSRISRIYRNDAGAFSAVGAGLAGVDNGALCWGDYDNDGDLDLAIAGEDSSFEFICRIYTNDAGALTDAYAGLPGVQLCSLSAGDADNDGDLDLMLSGFDTDFAFISRIYRNDGGDAPNEPPSAPRELLALVGGGEVLLSWEPATDLETRQAGLSYNVRIGKTTSDVGDYPSMADGLGNRRIPARGPVTDNPIFVSTWLALPPGVYFASVQAIDTSMEGGPWSDPVAFVIP